MEHKNDTEVSYSNIIYIILIMYLGTVLSRL